MHMINKGQVEGVDKKDILGQKKFALVSLWDSCPLKSDNHMVIFSLTTFCNTTRTVIQSQ